ncbi:hypothetical protein [Pseudomonas palleroniana]|uniref:hypothetical protein n=1 Tax=Pseudomonas palleroniana TaxID=191390 RepID=UPI001FCC83B0|nr:hypothetical protein [Pseudomonas palleroniana]UOK36287.1 hypothetical protein MJP36_17410 [Pseudomonas palleroniana]UOP10112.1 hypothetical protein LDL65_23975 [Pseudomonas palleroniana]
MVNTTGFGFFDGTAMDCGYGIAGDFLDAFYCNDYGESLVDKVILMRSAKSA